MTAMSPWTPEAIGRLTPLQLLCLGSDRPPSGMVVRTLEEYGAMADAMPSWDEIA